MKILLTAALFLAALAAAAQPKILAHRGFYKCEGSAPNSLTSMVKAGELGVAATEFDVHMTKDKVLVVNHDHTIGGHVISESLYNDIKDLTLPNGETLPTLDRVLEAAKRFPKMTLVIEIKHHYCPAEDCENAELTVAMVRAKRMEDRVCYISFSMDVLHRLLEVTPQSTLAYVNGDRTPAELHADNIRCMGYNHKVYTAHPEWVAEAHKLGMTVIAWTLNDFDVAERMYNLGVDWLETDYPHILAEWLKKKEADKSQNK